MKLSLFNIHDVALLITIVLCLLLVVFHSFYPDKNRIAKCFLIIFFIDIAIGISAVLMLWQPAIKTYPIVDTRIIPYILFGSLLLKGPLLYGYVSAATTPDYRMRTIDTVHFIPFVIYFLMLFMTNQTGEHIHLSDDKLIRTLSLYEWHSVKTIPFIYALMAGYTLRQKRKHHNASSNPLPETVWLDILVWGALLNWGWSLGTHLLGFYLGAAVADIFGILDNYMTSCLISALLAYSLAHTNRQLSASLSAKEKFPEENTEKQVIEKIIYCMEVEKLFLNPRLNIERMAEHIHTPYREVSAAINKHFHANFNEYVNAYRINEAKRLLADNQLLNLSINQIYALAGFNSKSAFHRFFSRLVGISPTEFRKLSTVPIKANCTRSLTINS